MDFGTGSAPYQRCGRPVTLAMTSQDREQINLLCVLIQDERDPVAFGVLVRELDELLATKEEPLNGGINAADAPTGNA